MFTKSLMEGGQSVVKERPHMSQQPAHSTINIQVTQDYGQFKYLAGNRPVTKYHIQQLINSFEENPSLIALRPLLVNEKMEIVDGQHRLQAAQALELPVYYIVAPGLTIAIAQLMNALQRSWNMMDFAHSYAFTGRDSYRQFLQYQEKYPLPATVLMLYLAGANRSRLHNDFRSGRFSLADDHERADTRLKQLSDFEALVPFWNTGPFAKAFFNVTKYEDYDHRRLLAGYEAIVPKRQASRLEYLRDFERAYNYGRPSSKVRFF